MKRLLTVLIALVAVVPILFYGWVFFLFAYMYLTGWPAPQTMVQSGYPLIPEAKQIDDLLGPAWHQTSNYEEPNTVEWQTNVLFAGRCELTMLIHVEIDRRSGRVLKVLEKPRFVLSEIGSVEVEPNGQIGISYGESQEFGLAEWQKVVAAKGDFSVIGIHLNRSAPVANFDKYLAYPRNGIQMAKEHDKAKP